METENKKSEEIKVDFSDKLVYSYKTLAEMTDLTDLLTTTLFASNEYNYSVIKANELTNRQGKNRRIYDHTLRPSETYELNTDLDYFEDKDLSELMILSLNEYMKDKHVLPTNERMANGIMNRVKALVIMLFNTNQYGIIPNLDLPVYMEKYVINAFKLLQEIQDETIDGWISYLNDSGNHKMSEITQSIGSEFWGLDTIKANSLYGRYFHSILTEIKDPGKTYNMFLYYRNEYFKTSKRTALNRLYDVFDITADAFNNAKRSFINEFPKSVTSDETLTLLYKLIYGN